MFDGPLPDGEATFVEDIEAVRIQPACEYTSQGPSGLRVCQHRHFFGEVPAGSVDLLIPSSWYPPLRDDQLQVAPTFDARMAGPARSPGAATSAAGTCSIPSGARPWPTRRHRRDRRSSGRTGHLPDHPGAGCALAEVRWTRRPGSSTGVVGDLPRVPVGVDEGAGVAAPVGGGTGLPILPPAASTSARTASTSAGERTLWARVTPPQPPPSGTVLSAASFAGSTAPRPCRRPGRTRRRRPVTPPPTRGPRRRPGDRCTSATPSVMSETRLHDPMVPCRRTARRSVHRLSAIRRFVHIRCRAGRVCVHRLYPALRRAPRPRRGSPGAYEVACDLRRPPRLA